MSDQIPLREHLESLFAQNKAHVDAQFSEIKAELVKSREHVHRQHPTWAQLITATVGLAAVATPLLVILL